MTGWTYQTKVGHVLVDLADDGKPALWVSVLDIVVIREDVRGGLEIFVRGVPQPLEFARGKAQPVIDKIKQAYERTSVR